MDVPNSYDTVPYWGNPYRDTHPDRMATMAQMFGLTPSTVNRCRVLELGCANAANLIPMAVALPDSTFVGIDLSQRQIDAGLKMIAAIPLHNIKLIHGSIENITSDHGLFDYIICHGVYSWVPRKIQDHILRICNVNLAPHGIAYVSYNTHPGWFMRGMVRRMMKFHANRFSAPETQLKQSRALLDFLSEASSGVDPAYHALLSRELNILRHCNDSYLYHEHLEENNEPLFFYEFMERAEAAGLRYLAEPHLSEMVPINVPPEVANVLGQVGPNIIEFEQYLDFLKNRTFRRTLLCHSELIPRREINPEQFQEFRFASSLKRQGTGGNCSDAGSWEFANPDGIRVDVTSPVHKAALATLEEAWPSSLTCDELTRATQQLLNPMENETNTPSVTQASISELIFPLYMRSLVEISAEPDRFEVAVSEHPRTSPYARLQAADGMVVTNLRHERVQLGALDHELLRHLDGNQNRETLRDLLANALIDGRLTIQNESGPLSAISQPASLFAEILNHSLKNLARQALLMQ